MTRVAYDADICHRGPSRVLEDAWVTMMMMMMDLVAVRKNR